MHKEMLSSYAKQLPWAPADMPAAFKLRHKVVRRAHNTIGAGKQSNLTLEKAPHRIAGVAC